MKLCEQHFVVLCDPTKSVMVRDVHNGWMWILKDGSHGKINALLELEKDDSLITTIHFIFSHSQLFRFLPY